MVESRGQATICLEKVFKCGPRLAFDYQNKTKLKIILIQDLQVESSPKQQLPCMLANLRRIKKKGKIKIRSYYVKASYIEQCLSGLRGFFKETTAIYAEAACYRLGCKRPQCPSATHQIYTLYHLSVMGNLRKSQDVTFYRIYLILYTNFGYFYLPSFLEIQIMLVSPQSPNNYQSHLLSMDTSSYTYIHSK